MDERIDQGISRRSAITRIAVVGAAAWSAPVLTSMSAPAFAEVGTDAPPPECSGQTCTTFTQCSASHPDCVCVTTDIIQGICVPGSTQCADLLTCPGGTGDCPDGQVCAVDTCCSGPVCVPLDLQFECVLPGPDSTGAARPSSGAGTIGG